jgi:hypothetical protein
MAELLAPLCRRRVTTGGGNATTGGIELDLDLLNIAISVSISNVPTAMISCLSIPTSSPMIRPISPRLSDVNMLSYTPTEMDDQTPANPGMRPP